LAGYYELEAHFAGAYSRKYALHMLERISKYRSCDIDLYNIDFGHRICEVVTSRGEGLFVAPWEVA